MIDERSRVKDKNVGGQIGRQMRNTRSVGGYETDLDGKGFGAMGWVQRKVRKRTKSRDSWGRWIGSTHKGRAFGNGEGEEKRFEIVCRHEPEQRKD